MIIVNVDEKYAYGMHEIMIVPTLGQKPTYFKLRWSNVIPITFFPDKLVRGWTNLIISTIQFSTKNGTTYSN